VISKTVEFDFLLDKGEKDMSTKDVVTILVPVVIIILLYWALNMETKRALEPETIIATEPPSNPYLSKYAGGYTIEKVGVSSSDVSEVYILHENGKAKWMRIENDGRGNVDIKSEKFGIWSAKSQMIRISIQGKISIINEDYIVIDGRFVNADPALSSRFLKRTK
jgi:hypothetical protein